MASKADSGGRIATNIINFSRLLRSAGIPVGSGQVLEAIRSLELIGIESRQDLYWCLFAQFVTRNSQRELFDQAFHIFWRNPRLREKLLASLLPAMADSETGQAERLSRRLEDAMASQSDVSGEARELQVQVDRRHSSSPQEVLMEKDFEAMSVAEIAEARKAIARLSLTIAALPTRRFRSSAQPGRADLRASLRAALRSSDYLPLKFRKPVRRRPPVVILCDISGSMSQYSRMLLHFMHALGNDRDRIHCFVFGTRLTNITRQLQRRDVDEALALTGKRVQDWSGGTRIGDCLKQFNQHWARRVLAQGAITLLISDGLDRGDDAELSRQMERLSKSSRRLLWLNPLLRYREFEPRARGIRAMLPWVDEFRSAHNLNSLAELAELLSSAPVSQRRAA